ncbi:uncharacterized protein PITG_07708 [Phytophthora infestans T30-4]|uniref:SnoaL-like domain-containing protein n=1 Tax=Phytophthora infestans (strain T30-4) TaxID=403677 RepID=D0N8Y0_PHYIT|nr:uncharacterized protein PITG_07708 [Phytophthora infestans T30-4]EEY54015.1 hypothetical protein PITG_07708 [Phytophthora infestans T30-4]KAI9983749.1 hypothetical protein PInf_007820 [Phytophthora infestans]|eukprot:XP_002904646.1 hypothetical protein PITG_07708 [Phytophthora infestans T30-4]
MLSTIFLAIPAFLATTATAVDLCQDGTALPSAPYHPPRPVTPAQQKAIFDRFADGFLLSGTPLPFLEDHLADDYIQHNPDFLSGKAAVLQGFSGDLSSFGLVYPANVITRGFDEDIGQGWIHYYFTPAAGQQPSVVVDIFRMNGSAIQEHWDVIQQRPENATNPLAMFTPPN